MIGISVKVETTGPVWSATETRRVTTNLTADARGAVAAQGYRMVHTELQRVIRNPTPYYWTRVAVTSRARDTLVVEDQGVVYGPWLEGVGSRNASSRFKGYRHWRRMRQQLIGRVGQILTPLVDKHLRGLR